MSRERKNYAAARLITLLTITVAGCQAGNATENQSETEYPTPIIIPIETVQPTILAEPTATSTPEPTPTPERSIASLAGGEYGRGNLDRKEISLTFDCGASGVPTSAILEALRKEGVRATFFITGQWARTYPNLTRQIAEEHEIANHSFSHPEFILLTNAQILEEMDKTEQIIADITGKSTKPFWRPPYGNRDSRVNSVVAQAGWPYSIMWTVERTAQGWITGDSGDWTNISPQEVTFNIMRASELGNGIITVSHCGSTQTAASLSQTLEILKSKGFRITTVSEILGSQ